MPRGLHSDLFGQLRPGWGLPSWGCPFTFLPQTLPPASGTLGGGRVVSSLVTSSGPALPSEARVGGLGKALVLLFPRVGAAVRVST